MRVCDTHLLLWTKNVWFAYFPQFFVRVWIEIFWHGQREFHISRLVRIGFWKVLEKYRLLYNTFQMKIIEYCDRQWARLFCLYKNFDSLAGKKKKCLFILSVSKISKYIMNTPNQYVVFYAQERKHQYLRIGYMRLLHISFAWWAWDIICFLHLQL